MKSVLKKLIGDEKGAALVMALILLLVGGLISAALLGHMGTGLLTGEVYDTRAAELYAADAGVEDAIWWISHNLTFDQDGYAHLGPLIVNDRSVEVEIYREEMPESTACRKVYRHQILSAAVTGDGGGTAAIDSSTTIEACLTATVEFADLSGLMDNIITINEDLTQHELDKLMLEVGKVNFACREECSGQCCGAVYDYDDEDPCYGCGVVYNYGGWWPSSSMLAAHYLADVDTEDGYPEDTLYVQDYSDGVGPLYRDGKLDVINMGEAGLTLKLNDTVYITGNTTIGSTGHNFILDLNGQAIFVESPSQGEGKEALKIGGRVTTILGPGAIIAVGDIYFAPDGDAGSNEEPVFIFSVSGTTRLQPSGGFYGAIAGNFYVQVLKGEEPTLTYPPGGFGDAFDFFPSMLEVDRTYSVVSWEISQQ
jgi:hypothetical protein